jgi:hypothetical protein
MAPDPCSKIQYPSYNPELLVNRSRHAAGFSTIVLECRKRVVVNPIQRKLADIGHHDFQGNHVALY